MAILPNIATKRRKSEMQHADIKNLVKGVALLAAGILAISCITTEWTFPVRGILCGIGAAMCVP